MRGKKLVLGLALSLLLSFLLGWKTLELSQPEYEIFLAHHKKLSGKSKYKMFIDGNNVSNDCSNLINNNGDKLIELSKLISDIEWYKKEKEKVIFNSYLYELSIFERLSISIFGPSDIQFDRYEDFRSSNSTVLYWPNQLHAYLQNCNLTGD